MIAIGAGGLDVAVCMAGHPFELPCPKIVGVLLENELARPWIQAKDVILELLRRRGVRGGRGAIFEFTGPGVATLSYTERGTIANMIAELGATGAVFPADDETRVWLTEQQREDDFAELAAERRRRLRRARSTSTWPSSCRWSRSPQSPGNVVPVRRGGRDAELDAGLHRLVGQLRRTHDLALCGAVLRGGSRSPTSSSPRPPRPARVRSSTRSRARASTSTC